MDGLSVAASVAGLIHVSAKVIKIISDTAGASNAARSVLAEARDLQSILHQLQGFISNFEEQRNDQRSTIRIEQLVATLTGCVCVFSELDKVLEELNNRDAGSLLRLWDSAKWALKDSVIGRILSELQQHKASLTLMLTIITWQVTTISQQMSG